MKYSILFIWLLFSQLGRAQDTKGDNPFGFDNKKLEDSIAYYQETMGEDAVLSYVEKIKDKTLKDESNHDNILLMSYLVHHYIRKGSIGLAFKSLFLATEICTEKDSFNLLLTHRMAAKIYGGIGEFKLEEEYLKKEYELLTYLTVPQKKYQLSYSTRIAYNNYKIQNFEEAKIYFRRVLELASKDEIGFNYNNLGLCYRMLNQLDSAEFFFNKGISELQDLENLTKNQQIHLGLLKGSLGVVMWKRGREEEAIALWEENYIATKHLNYDANALLVGASLIRAYLSLKNYERIEAIIQEINQLFSKDVFQATWLTFYKSQLDYYAYTGQIDNLLAVRENITELRKVIQNNENKRQNILFQLVELSEELEGERELLVREKELSELKQNDLFTKRMIILGFVLLSLFTGYILLNYRKKLEVDKKNILLSKLEHQLTKVDLENKQLETNQLQVQIQSQDKDTTNFALSLDVGKEFVQEIQSDLKILFEEEQLTTDKTVQELMLYLDDYRNNPEENVQVQDIKEANLAFFDILRNKYPQLTENDLKMCSLIRLGYSNKEIATIRGIEPGSVKRSKTRMRKKIGLEKEANLTKLFTSIQPIINNKEE